MLANIFCTRWVSLLPAYALLKAKKKMATFTNKILILPLFTVLLGYLINVGQQRRGEHAASSEFLVGQSKCQSY